MKSIWLYKHITGQTIDLFVVLVTIAISIVASLSLEVRFLTATLLFFGLPSLYLLLRRPAHLKKALIGATLLGGGCGVSHLITLQNSITHGDGQQTQTLHFP